MEKKQIKQEKTVSIEDVIHQSPSCCKKSSVHWLTDSNNKTLNTSPSFNLRTCQKSTPIRPCQKCQISEAQNDQNISVLRKHSQPNKTENQIETVIEVHSETDQESDQNRTSGICSNDSFHSC